MRNPCRIEESCRHWYEKVTRLQVKPHDMDYVLFFTVIILCAVGIITVYSASTVIALQAGVSASSFATKQLLFGLIGLVMCVVISRIPYQFWYRFAVPLTGISGLLLVMVLIPHVGTSVRGGQRWLGGGSMHLQPSELAIISTVIYLAFFFTKKVMYIRNFKRGLLPGLIIAAINFGLIMKEPDMGTGLTLLATSMVLVFGSGARLKPLFVMLGAIAPILVGLALTESYRMHRIQTWLHPFSDPSSTGLQLIQGMTAISAGGWFGRGFDMGIQKMGYLPEPQTDFIFPVFVEEWGLIGAVALMVTFCILIWRGFRIARRSPDRFGALLSVGLTGMFTINAVINLGAVTGLLPVTGIPLPFVSYGGTALVVYLMSMGILLSVSRYTLDVEPEVDHAAEVIAVEDVEHIRGRKEDKQPLFQRRTTATKPRRAEVHPLKPRTERQDAVRETWRSRQEVAVAKEPKRKPQKQSQNTHRPATWRERNGSHDSTGDHGSRTRKGLFRKD
jgi:cell division protein FtsW